MISFADLPAELLGRIASHLFYPSPQSHGKYQDAGLCNLRLSCRCLESKTRYYFERAAFSTMAVTLHAKSLSRLRDVSCHPSFGKLIKKLVFCKAHHPVFDKVFAPLEVEGPSRTHEHAGYGVIELSRRGHDDVYPNEALTIRKRVHLGLEHCLAAVMAHTPDLREVIIEPNFMASFWLDGPSRQEQLNEQAQRIYHSTSDINTRERERYEHESYDHEAAEESDSSFDIPDDENEDYDTDEIDDPFNLETYVYPDYLLYVAARAAHHRDLQLSSLSSINISTPSIRARTFVEIAPALRRLRRLSISINASNAIKLKRMNGSTLHDHEDGQPMAESLGHAINGLRDLQSLSFTFDDYYWEHDRRSNISASLRGLDSIPFEHLSSIDLNLLCFEGHELYHFLRGARNKLQNLGLCCITLATVEHWRPILAMMLEEMPMLTTARCAELTGGSTFDDTSLQQNRFRGWEGCCVMNCSERCQILIELKWTLDQFSSSIA